MIYNACSVNENSKILKLCGHSVFLDAIDILEMAYLSTPILSCPTMAGSISETMLLCHPFITL